jgi:hypothetical protein
MSEELARKFHDIYERLAPDFGYETRSDTREFDPESPNGGLMIAVCSEIPVILQERNAEPPELERVKAAWAIYTGHSEITWEEAWQRSEPPKPEGGE